MRWTRIKIERVCMCCKERESTQVVVIDEGKTLLHGSYCETCADEKIGACELVSAVESLLGSIPGGVASA